MEYINYAAERGMGEEISSFVKEALNPNNQFTFSVEAQDGQYVHKMYDHGEEVYSEPLGVDNLSDDEIHTLTTGSQYYNQVLFENYLKAVTGMGEITNSFTPQK